jgi:hypothetical protein
MTDLLDLAVTAHRGINRFDQFKTVSAHFVLGGRMWALKGQEGKALTQVMKSQKEQ